MYKRQVTDMEQLVQVQILAQTITEFCNSMTAGLEAVLNHRLSPSLVPEDLLAEDFQAFTEEAARSHLTPVIDDHKQVYQLTAYFVAKRGKALEVYVRVPLKPDRNHAMFSLFLHKSLPTLRGESVVRIHGDKNILAVGPATTQFSELTETELAACTRIGETHLCNFKHNWTSDPGTSCLAAIYFEDAAAIQLRCRVTSEPADFLLERLNGTSLVSVAKKATTVQIQCGSRRSVQQLQGTQIGRLAHSCSIAAGHSAMAASADNPPSSSFQIRAIPKSLTDKLEDWGHNQDLAAIVKRIGNKGHLQQLKAQVSNLTKSSVDKAVEESAPCRMYFH